MIDRYILPEMAKVWDEGTKIANWMKVEKAVIEALGEVGEIDKDEAADICNCIQSYIEYPFPIVQAARLKEEETKHDLAAFVDVLSEQVEHEVEAGRWIHFGLTSSDVVDTAFSMQIVEAIDLVFDKIMELEDTLLKLAYRHKHDVIMGRTHGMFAEPTTFGLIMLNYYVEFLRHMNRLHSANDIIKVGKLSGAVGTFSHLNPEVEVAALNSLGLKSARISSQILQRDRHAEVFTTLALIGSSIEKLATQIRLWQRTEVSEVRESFAKGQKGSSAMPHKKNPILSENLCGLARLLRGYAQSAMENIALWHERDISHSSVERVIAPDAFALIHFMLDRMDSILVNLDVDTRRMMENMFEHRDAWTSQAAMLELVRLGFMRKDAYEIVQSAAQSAYRSGYGFGVHLQRELQRAELSEEEIVRVIDSTALERHLRNVDQIFERVETYGQTDEYCNS